MIADLLWVVFPIIFSGIEVNQFLNVQGLCNYKTVPSATLQVDPKFSKLHFLIMHTLKSSLYVSNVYIHQDSLKLASESLKNSFWVKLKVWGVSCWWKPFLMRMKKETVIPDSNLWSLTPCQGRCWSSYKSHPECWPWLPQNTPTVINPEPAWSCTGPGKESRDLSEIGYCEREK